MEGYVVTQDEIFEMARQAGWKDLRDYDSEMRDDIFMGSTGSLKAFAKLVAEKEREACAKVCDDELKEWGIFDSDVGDVSKAIRARGENK